MRGLSAWGRALTARGMTMARFAGLLRGRVDRPVLDRTDFTAAYDLELEWSSDLGLQQAPPGAAGANELTPEGLSCLRHSRNSSVSSSTQHADPWTCS